MKLVWFTTLLLILALLISILWNFNNPDYEPVVTSLALLASIVGYFAERLHSEKENRRSQLQILIHEICNNISVLTSQPLTPDTIVTNKPLIYPRLYVSALQSVIASGLFNSKKDKKLFKLLHSSQQRTLEFNRCLDITELRTFSKLDPAEIKALHNGALNSNARKNVNDVLAELSALLLSDYSKESGYNKDTMVFNE